MNGVDEKLKEIIVRCGVGIEKEKINLKTNLINDLGFESVNIVELVVDIETEFDVEIEDEYLDPSIIAEYDKLLEMVLKLTA